MAFAAFIAILVPSYRKFALDWQATQSRQLFSTLHAGFLLSTDSSRDSAELSQTISRISASNGILGWQVFSADKMRILQAKGSTPDDPWDSDATGYIAGFFPDSYTDVFWSAEKLNTPYHLKLRLDVSRLQPALNDYVLRIAGLVALQQSEQHLAKLANFDDLTGLANRHLALEKLSMELERAESGNRSGALMFIDLDNFKDINDTLGQGKGDDLLRQSARRMQNAVRYLNCETEAESTSKPVQQGLSVSDRESRDIIARIGGDEFMVILPEIDQQGTENVAVRIQRACSKPFLLHSSEGIATAVSAQ